jgi:hypothetical protein
VVYGTPFEVTITSFAITANISNCFLVFGAVSIGCQFIEELPLFV